MSIEKPATIAEMDALPVGPFVEKREQWTQEEIAAGEAVGAMKVWYELPATLAVYREPNDIMGWRGSDGQMWTLGQWANGEWFKQRLHP